MTAKRCTDCRHTKGIGYDFWCGEGHTEYEVFGAETNCPYFEYHDWSKGVPSITEKRFTLDNEENGLCKCILMDGEEIETCEVVKLLNELSEENEQLRKDATTLIYSNQDYRKENEELKENCRNYNWYKEYKQLLNENEQLKHRLAISEKANFVTALEKENEQLRKENEKLEALWEDKCVREYLTACGESILKEMHDEKYGDKE